MFFAIFVSFYRPHMKDASWTCFGFDWILMSEAWGAHKWNARMWQASHVTMLHLVNNRRLRCSHCLHSSLSFISSTFRLIKRSSWAKNLLKFPRKFDCLVLKHSNHILNDWELALSIFVHVHFPFRPYFDDEEIWESWEYFRCISFYSSKSNRIGTFAESYWCASSISTKWMASFRVLSLFLYSTDGIFYNRFLFQLMRKSD